MKRTSEKTSFVALLRGINSGRNPSVKMEVLKAAFEDLGFSRVGTILASGNVVFESVESLEQELERTLESALPATLGFQTMVIVRSGNDILKLVRRNPLKTIKMTPMTRANVTFLKHNPGSPRTKTVRGNGYQILGAHDRIICSIVDLKRSGTLDVMKALEKEFGKDITTRTWATVEKIAKSLSRSRENEQSPQSRR